MVKVAENRVVDLDVFPGDKQGDQLAQQARYDRLFLSATPLVGSIILPSTDMSSQRCCTGQATT